MFIESMCNHLSASEDTGKLKLHLDSSKCQLLQPCLFSIYDDILNILHRFIISFAFLAKPSIFPLFLIQNIDLSLNEYWT